jgi:tRNA threonylcarbamoyladenosine biosynthesis protein TsaB
MNIDNKIYLALDTAYEHGRVVVFNKNEILYSRLLKEKMAHSKEICYALLEAKKFCKDQKIFLDGVFSGLGPGSFIGIRIALATALGFSFAYSLPLMGFCSQLALAYSVINTCGHYYIFMKASGDLGYFSEFRLIGGTLHIVASTSVMPLIDVCKEINPLSVIFSDQAKKIATLDLPVKVLEIHGPTDQGIIAAALNTMKNKKGFIDESDFIKPNYIKAPSISLPKKNLVIAHPVG